MPHDLQVEMLPVARLAPYAANARLHPDAQVAQMAARSPSSASTPVLVDGDGVHHRRPRPGAGGEDAGLEAVPAIELGHLTEAQKRAYRLADNQLALNAGWDEALLAAGAARLCGSRLRPRPDRLRRGRAGPAARRLGARDGAGADGDPDAPCPEPPAVPVSRARRSLAARARTACSAATPPSAADVARLLDGVRPHLMVTRSALWRELRPGLAQRSRRRGARPAHRQGAERRPRRLARGLGAVPRRCRLCLARRAARADGGREPGGRRLRHPLADHLGQGAAGARPRRLPLAARALLVRRPQGRHRPLEGRPQADDALGHPAAATRRGDGHGTQKPVECMRRPMQNNSSPGQAVYEPFCGSRHHAHRRRDDAAAPASPSSSTRPMSMSRSSAGSSSPASRGAGRRGADLRRHRRRPRCAGGGG